MTARGRFITLEGGEGAGKSTQQRRLATWLRESGLDVVETREPGGSPGAEQIRQLLVTGEAGRWDPLTEALLHFAARRDHRHGTPAPSSDHVHIVDERFSGDGSTTVFPLANTAAVDSVMAYVSGARTPVTLGGTLDDEITFGSAPGSGTDNISVDYAAVLT